MGKIMRMMRLLHCQ